MGALHELRTGTARATVSEYAAGLRGLEVAGIVLVHGGVEPSPPLSAGVVLVPWPNRVDGGLWELDGRLQQLECNEPEFGNANHGLLSQTRYAVAWADADALRLEAPVEGRAGYPFRLATAVEYHAVPDGVRVRHEITNLGDRAAPIAVGAHPYLGIGDTKSRDLEIRVRAGAVLDLDERHIPRGISSVAAGSDLRDWTPLDDVMRHGCLAALDVSDGLLRHGLRERGGAEVELWADPEFGYAQLYITDALPGLGAGEVAVAIEPMTAPPNALRSGFGLTWLEPGERWSAEWGIRLVAGDSNRSSCREAREHL
ncbi:aldose epimerase family protein [Agromyces ramosus]|uniref:Aldose 1-epimerase n=1 Tax=Agromyces ramosus TaxID=33879 RepID=A0ABU0RAP6_9MICO|nr:aldose epimerase [Agromyces ramosus]MDQ0895153.1 aldose 1-epimerase [Agromyces ramosus]